MRSQHLRMSWEEYQRFPRSPGWKCEYWDGQVHLSPRHLTATATLELRPRPVDPRVVLRPVTPADKVCLVTLFVAAFTDTIEYCDWEAAQIEASAGTNVTSFFQGTRGRPLAASRVAADAGRPGAELVGAALIIAGADDVPHLDLLFVAPGRQRQGVATALVAAAGNELYRDGARRLRSRYDIGNAASRAWHQRMGFVEEPDLVLARVYLDHARHELERHDRVGHLGPAEQADLLAACERWRATVEELARQAANAGADREARPGPGRS